MDQALDLLPSDYWRWWLLANAPESGDAEFTWEKFQAGVNKDLADVLGNFVSRVTKFCRSKFGEEVPAGGEMSAAGRALVGELTERLAVYTAHMEAIEVRKAAAELRAIWVAGNEFLQSAAPWTTIKEDRDRAAADIRLALNLVHLYAVISEPFLPDAAARLLEALRTDRRDWPDNLDAALEALPPGHGFVTPETLFAKIDDATRDDWASRFAGTRAA
jgi:methionyl-tRNA synthetase